MELQLDSFLHRLPIFIQQDEALRKIFFRGQDIALHMSTCLLFADTDSADLPLETAANLLRRTPLCFDDAAAELLPMLSAILATSDDMDLMLDRMQAAYRALCKVFIPSARLLLPACAFAESPCTTEQFLTYAKRIFTIFEEVHDAHPILTGYEDLGVFTLFALYETPEMDLIRRAKSYADRLDDDYFFRNAIQALGHALAFSEDVEDMCTRVQALSDAAKSAKINLRKGNLPAVLAPAAVMHLNPEAFVQALSAADDILSKADGFSPLILSSKERLLFSAMAIIAHLIHTGQTTTEMQYAFRAALFSVTGFYAADSTDSGHVPI